MDEPETRLSRREVEQLLDAPAAHDSALGWALTAVSAPAHPGELHREDATVAAFHNARVNAPGAAPTPAPTRSRFGARAGAQAVIATAAVLALASGGFALTGSIHLPDLPGQASDRATEAVETTARSPRTTKSTTEAGDDTDAAPRSTTTDGSRSPGGPASTDGSRSPEPATTGARDDASDDASPEAEPGNGSDSPTPSFTGLCRAFQASDHSQHGSSLDSAAFTALATQAGGPEKVAAYCVALIGPPKETGKPTSKPTPGKPTAKPTPVKPTSKPSPSKPTPTAKPTPGKPTAKPTPDKPTVQPSPNKPIPGKPTDKPAPAGQGGSKGGPKK